MFSWQQSNHDPVSRCNVHPSVPITKGRIEHPPARRCVLNLTASVRVVNSCQRGDNFLPAEPCSQLSSFLAKARVHGSAFESICGSNPCFCEIRSMEGSLLLPAALVIEVRSATSGWLGSATMLAANRPPSAGCSNRQLTPALGIRVVQSALFSALSCAAKNRWPVA